MAVVHGEEGHKETNQNKQTTQKTIKTNKQIRTEQKTVAKRLQTAAAYTFIAVGHGKAGQTKTKKKQAKTIPKNKQFRIIPKTVTKKSYTTVTNRGGKYLHGRRTRRRRTWLGLRQSARSSHARPPWYSATMGSIQGGRRAGARGEYTHVMHGRSRTTIDPSIRTMRGQNMSGFHRTGIACTKRGAPLGVGRVA